jgi:hypothetical protein
VHTTDFEVLCANISKASTTTVGAGKQGIGNSRGGAIRSLRPLNSSMSMAKSVLAGTIQYASTIRVSISLICSKATDKPSTPHSCIHKEIPPESLGGFPRTAFLENS